jgi:hypothetical protein
MPDDPLLAALRRKSVAYRGAGLDEWADRVDARITELESQSEADEGDAESSLEAVPEPEPEPEPDGREDGYYSVGGGWHEVVVDGQVVDKVRGAEAAQEAFDAQQSED